MVRRSTQPDLFASEPAGPEGFAYVRDLIDAAGESALEREIAGLPFREFEFRGYLGKRRVVSFGWRYDFSRQGLRPADEIPAFLLPLREKAAALAGLDPAAFVHVLVTEYGPGAAIGWHRDRPEFGDVVGVSLMSPCLFRFRRRVGQAWERASFLAEPRSAYLLRGPARTEWEHSIPGVDALRYSVTFRTLRGKLDR